MKITHCILKNFKCYQATTIVKLGEEGNITGIVGENGVGKSAVLEALNTFFTDKNWVRNKNSKKGDSECSVGVIIYGNEKDFGKLTFDYDRISQSLKKKLKKTQTIDEKGVYLGVLISATKEIKLYDGEIIQGENEKAEELRKFLLQEFSYIYIKAEVDIDEALNINSETIGLIKGLPMINEIANNIITPVKEDGKNIIDIITQIVDEYFRNSVVTGLKKLDKDYDYKNIVRGASTSISKEHLAYLAVQSIFNSKQLTKKRGTKDIGLGDMSSGQRRACLLDFILVLIRSLEDKKKRKIILAIDEPEISVGASSRVQQFLKLWELSSEINLCLFTTHWYGWINQFSSGNALYIEEDINLERSHSNFSLSDTITVELPFEMRVIFDFLTSVGAWAEIEKSKKFIIVEGSTDDILIRKHFEHYVIIKSRGQNVKHLAIVLRNYSLKGKTKLNNLFVLIDTDPGESDTTKDAMTFEGTRRITRNSLSEVKIVNDNSELSNKAAIEDLLSPRPFLDSLKKNISELDNDDDKDFINKINIKYQNKTGTIAFGFDFLESEKFFKIYKKAFKEKVIQDYSPNEDEKKVFISIFNL